MTQSTAPTMPARPGDIRVSGEKRAQRSARERSARNVRRRWLILFAVVIVVVVAILANIGPLAHYQDAGARLDKASAKVAGLEAQKAKLQGDLAKLGESGYLETLAREQLAYAKPGEDLYIVTGSSGQTTVGDAQSGAAESDSGLPGAAAAVGAGIREQLSPDTAGTTAVTTPAEDAATGTAAAGTGDRPGFFERVISAVRGLF